jgi:hypothetical protein
LSACSVAEPTDEDRPRAPQHDCGRRPAQRTFRQAHEAEGGKAHENDQPVDRHAVGPAEADHVEIRGVGQQRTNEEADDRKEDRLPQVAYALDHQEQEHADRNGGTTIKKEDLRREFPDRKTQHDEQEKE